MADPLPPGATVGICGGGQLGRMLALEAKRHGYLVHVFTPEDASPTSQVSDAVTVAPFSDLAAVERFAAAVDVVTLEFENVPTEALEAARRYARVHPSPEALAVTRHRLREKRFLQEFGHPVTPFEPIDAPSELRPALDRLGGRAVLKTATLGYDGKGQVRLEAGDPYAFGEAEALAATGEAILEQMVAVSLELSVVAARAEDGRTAVYPLFENLHRHHILDVTVAPARVSAAVAQRAYTIGRAVLEALSFVGVACVELFLTTEGELLVNEIAPRPHNSGHLTLGAARCSQFAQQLRAICGLPLGATDLFGPAAMANLLGDLWAGGEPDWERLLAHGVDLHLYGKSEPRQGRKMGHVTAVAATVDEAEGLVIAARRSLAAPPLPLPEPE